MSTFWEGDETEWDAAAPDKWAASAGTPGVPVPPAEDRCTCCDLPLSGCGKAAEARQLREQRQRPERTRTPHGAEVTARYPGRCENCGSRFVPDETRIRWDEVFTAWVCVPCADEVLDP